MTVEWSTVWLTVCALHLKILNFLPQKHNPNNVGDVNAHLTCVLMSQSAECDESMDSKKVDKKVYP